MEINAKRCVLLTYLQFDHQVLLSVFFLSILFKVIKSFSIRYIGNLISYRSNRHFFVNTWSNYLYYPIKELDLTETDLNTWVTDI